MLHSNYIYRLLLLIMLVCGCTTMSAQKRKKSKDPEAKAWLRRQHAGVEAATSDTILVGDSVYVTARLSKSDSLSVGAIMTETDSTLTIDASRLKPWKPDPKKAMWYAIVFPGGGQIYNHKYWKLPIIYGGFLGCVYALNWNNTMYRDYSQAYIDIMDSDPNTQSYMNFIPQSYNVDANLQRLQDLFRRRKDFYRRNRDLSIFCMIGVYALSVIDAYVDAELSSFDISRDLSLKVRPSIINDRQHALRTSPYSGNSYGVQCSLSF